MSPRQAKIINRGRGPEISGTRITVYDVLDYRKLGWHRDRIAAFEPRVRPLIDWLCQHAGCTVAPLKRIEAIAIDSSSFKKDRDNAYRLNLAIKSSATVAIAMPSVELTLTDAQDQPVLRRVLTPSEMGAAEVMAPLGEWSASLPISVTADNVAARIAGYRVVAFYP